jgi:uncharacterized membrane protein YraQ (UPF0718 family)
MGLKIGGKMFVGTLPMLILAFIIAGLIQVLIPKEFINNWLSTKAGFKGIIIGALAGAITPSAGPFVIYPVAVSLYKAGAGMGTVVAYILGHFFWGVSGIPFSLSLLGPRIFLAKYISCLIVPLLAGIIAQILFK